MRTALSALVGGVFAFAGVVLIAIGLLFSLGRAGAPGSMIDLLVYPAVGVGALVLGVLVVYVGTE